MLTVSFNDQFRRRFQLIVSACALVVATCLGGCAERKNDPVQVSQVNFEAAIKTVTRDHIVPLTQNFMGYSDNLVQAAEAFCLMPDASGLQALQGHWKTVQRQWFALANYKFGPLVDDIVFPRFTFIDSYRLRGTQYISTVRAEVSKDVNSGENLNEGYFANKTFQYVGLLPLEVLLFETMATQERDISVVVTEFREHPKKCTVLYQLSLHLFGQAKLINQGWEQDYGGSGKAYAHLLESGELAFGETPISVVLVGVQEHLDYLQKRDVVNNTAQVADYAWQSLRASIEDIQWLLEQGPGSAFSFFKLMTSAGYATTVAEVKDNIQFALDSIDQRDSVNLQLALSQLDGNFKRNIPNALDVNLGINFTDGD